MTHYIFGVRRQLATVILATGVLTGLALAPGVALADAGARASCMGHEASSISPPGSHSEFPGGMPELTKFLKATFKAEGPGAHGAFIKWFAQLHAGSHEACDAAAGE